MLRKSVGVGPLLFGYWKIQQNPTATVGGFLPRRVILSLSKFCDNEIPSLMVPRYAFDLRSGRPVVACIAVGGILSEMRLTSSVSVSLPLGEGGPLAVDEGTLFHNAQRDNVLALRIMNCRPILR